MVSPSFGSCQVSSCESGEEYRGNSSCERGGWDVKIVRGGEGGKLVDGGVDASPPCEIGSDGKCREGDTGVVAGLAPVALR